MTIPMPASDTTPRAVTVTTEADANEELIRRIFEEVIPGGDATTMRGLFAPDWVDHDPLPGQPTGRDGAAYVVTTMHTAHPDLRSPSMTWSPYQTGSWSDGRCAARTPGRCSDYQPPASRSSSPLS